MSHIINMALYEQISGIHYIPNIKNEYMIFKFIKEFKEIVEPKGFTVYYQEIIPDDIKYIVHFNVISITNKYIYVSGFYYETQDDINNIIFKSYFNYELE